MWRLAVKCFEEHRERKELPGSQSAVIWGWRQQVPHNQSFQLLTPSLSCPTRCDCSRAGLGDPTGAFHPRQLCVFPPCPRGGLCRLSDVLGVVSTARSICLFLVVLSLKSLLLCSITSVNPHIQELHLLTESFLFVFFSLCSFPCGTHEDEAEDTESCPAVQPAPHAAGAAGQAETLGGGGALTWRRGKTTQK